MDTFGLAVDSLGMDQLLGPQYIRNDPNYHSYILWNPICKLGTRGCTQSNVFETLRRYPAPGYHVNTKCKIKNGNAKKVPYLGGVTHLVDYQNMAIANITNGDHLLHSGKVVRQVSTVNDIIYVYTFGDGTGNFGYLNEVLRNVVWDPIDDQISRSIRLSDPNDPSVRCGCE